MGLDGPHQCSSSGRRGLGQPLRPAFVSAFRWLLDLGGLCLVVSVVLTGRGLLWNLGD